MAMVSIETGRQFEKHYRKLPKALKEAAKQKEIIFRENPLHPSLGTHKLHGKDAGAWAFSINRKLRIKFVFLTNDSVLFLDIGTHDMYS
ncbi:MAG: type II toxin-antitoxin system mRNA interferase toxin, RelE/StbE family [bacterium]|nr:type II toxin-antitoxin system mRNA interferase toxin, RelE/StbE family [bacterium]